MVSNQFWETIANILTQQPNTHQNFPLACDWLEYALLQTGWNSGAWCNMRHFWCFLHVFTDPGLCKECLLHLTKKSYYIGINDHIFN